MTGKRILLVDDEPTILTVLKRSLEIPGAGYKIIAVTNGFAALDELQAQAIDLIVTDYNMAKMDGLELLESIHYLHPSTPVIMITAFGGNVVEDEAQRLKVYRYLTKPLDINAFRQTVQDALEDCPVDHQTASASSNQRYHQVNQLLGQLCQDVSARCLFVTNIQGNLIARSGHIEKVPIEEVASLLGGGIATLNASGKMLDGDQKATNLVYRESKNGYLYAVNIGRQLLLILVIDRGQYSSRLGTVWYYIQQTADKLRKILSNVDYSDTKQIFDASLEQDFGNELDELFAV